MYRTYFDANTGKCLGSYQGPDEGNPYAGQPSVEGQYPNDTVLVDGVAIEPTETERLAVRKDNMADLPDGVLRAVALTMWDQINILRQAAGMERLTAANLETAVKAHL